jgi:hypothetical protein
METKTEFEIVRCTSCKHPCKTEEEFKNQIGFKLDNIPFLTCVKCRQRSRNRYNPEIARVQHKEYRESHKEEIKQKKAEYRQTHKEQLRESRKKYEADNKERIATRNNEKVQCPDCKQYMARRYLPLHLKKLKYCQSIQ